MFSHAALNASLNGTSAILLAGGYVAIRSGKIAVHKAFMLGVCGLVGFSGFLSAVSLPRRPCRVSRAGMDSAGVFCAAHDAYHSRGGDCADDSGHAAACLA